MTENRPNASRPTIVGIIAGVLVLGGVLLWMFVSKGFLFVAGIGAFGPGVLREIGWLRDQDEFQRQSARRAGYHAYLAGGICAVLLDSAIEWPGSSVEVSGEWIRFLVVVLWMAWLYSSMMEYWGARKTASRILIVFGSFWAVFVIATLIGDAGSGIAIGELLLGILAGVFLTATFFLPAWTAHRWPRPTGIALVVLTLAVFVIFGLRKGGLSWETALFTDLILLVPLLISGIALIRESGESAAADPGGSEIAAS